MDESPTYVYLSSGTDQARLLDITARETFKKPIVRASQREWIQPSCINPNRREDRRRRTGQQPHITSLYSLPDPSYHSFNRDIWNPEESATAIMLNSSVVIDLPLQ
jgi:hypothetical protein